MNFVILFIILCTLVVGLFIYKISEHELYSDSKVLKLNRGNGEGFFSECNYKLVSIIDYFNDKKQLPNEVKSEQIFELYKPQNISNVNDYFFDEKRNVLIKYNGKVDYKRDYDTQLNNYKRLNLDLLNPFIKRYFSPSSNIIKVIQNLVYKYNINPNNVCGVYYRGTDKYIETDTGKYSEYISKMLEVRNQNNNIQFFLQSDDTNFIKYASNLFPGSIIIKENQTSEGNKGIHTINTVNENFKMQIIFVSIIYILSQCKYVILSSSNVSLFLVLIRNNTNNIYQYSSMSNSKWF